MQSNETWDDLLNWRRPTARSIQLTDLVLDFPGCHVGDLFEYLRELSTVTSLHVSETFSSAIVHLAASETLAASLTACASTSSTAFMSIIRPITAPRSRPSWPAVSNEISLGMLSKLDT
jgi:hypothetical protein